MNRLDPKDIKAIAKETAKILLENIDPLINNRSANISQTYSITQVAEITNLSQKTIRDHIKKGLLVASRTGNKFLITKENLNNYIQ